MKRRKLGMAILAAILLSPRTSTGEPLSWARQLPPEKGQRLTGTWEIRFENGVIERCEFRADGSAFEQEPLRQSAGKATHKGAFTMVVFEDDRTERWTRVDGMMVVEHWCPSSTYPHGSPVVGAAKSVR